jgi:LysR family transcriptional regulator for metE and metH
LRGLESHYTTPVVKRKGQTVELTEAGRRLLVLARSVLSDVQNTERDLARLADIPTGTLRIALECHTCFDWLMPVMDTFRNNWPEVELDLVSGFHPDPAELLRQDRADLVIGSDNKRRTGIVHHPLFRFEILAVLATDHQLASKKVLSAKDFTGETLITYPVPEERIDVIRQVLKPGRVQFERRTAELTIAILQLVASRRGIAALPNWGIKNYVDYEYVIARRIGSGGLWSDLYGAMTREMTQKAYALDFIETIKTTCFANLTGLVALP